MVEAPKRTSSPVEGCRQVRAASSLKRACKSPGAGGAANSGPMIAKRRAHRSRLSGSSSHLTDCLPTAVMPALLLWRAGYEALVRPATGILCGSAHRAVAPLDLLDHGGGTEGTDKAQQLYQPLMTGRALEPCKQTLRQAFSRHWRREAFADRPPERGSLEIPLPPAPPSLHRAHRYRHQIRECARGRTGRRRDQHQHGRHIHSPANEAHRRRRRACITPAAGKAQPKGVLLAHRSRAAARLTRKICHVQGASALRTAPLTSLGGELRVNLGEKTEKSGIVQRMAHCGGLLAW